MSADTYYVIRKHPYGGYAAVLGDYAYTGGWPEVIPDWHCVCSTVAEAYSLADEEGSEYGIQLHPEVQQDANEELITLNLERYRLQQDLWDLVEAGDILALDAGKAARRAWKDNPIRRAHRWWK